MLKSIAEHIYNFLADKRFALPLKASLVILSIAMLFLLNNFLGWSFNYSTNQKIKQLQAIVELKKSNTHTQEYLEHINKIEREILERKPFFSTLNVPSWLKKDSSSKLPQQTSTSEPTETPATTIIEKSDTPSPYKQPWLMLSAAWLFILTFMAVLFGVPFSKNFRAKDFPGYFAGLLILAFLIWLLQFLAGLIPPITSAKPWINYVLYSAFWLVAILLGTSFSESNDAEKRTEKRK
ncbi:hypothetical protein Emin_0291 [Elusimicrobium minutum Pei191]|uniref:Uncharacterized protein n=1 Tax=Elusimicrobium minutum (strain Pei191) TaxID=445932 RepID=B2KBU8_ELUMP|nr:hypothetical protein [Elusimicrobium minutum]ACC97852.1 hypothetical protein Emin_0291 [Elusimicrobium minutum Pei191]